MKYAFNLVIKGFFIMVICLAMEWNFIEVSSTSIKILIIILQWIITMSTVTIIDLICNEVRPLNNRLEDDYMASLNNVLIIKYLSDEKGNQLKKDLVSEICSWDGFNTNNDLTNWGYYSPREGIIILGCNSKPEVEWEELFKSYRCLKRLNVFYTTKYSFGSLPSYCVQDYSAPCMELYDKFRLSKVNWEQICNLGL